MADLLDFATFDGMKELLEDEFPSFLETFFTENQDALLRIEQGLASTDAEMVKGAAHNLKSSSGYLGATQLAELAQHIEEQSSQGHLTGLETTYQQAQGVFDAIKAQIS